MCSQFSPPVVALIDAFHAQNPPRSWSLIVTIFGDAAMTHTGAIWLGDLTEWLGLMRIEPGGVRTALSRLVGAQLLTREKAGKSAYYRLSTRAETEFRAAGGVIYGAVPREATGGFDLCLIDACPDRAEARDALIKAGYAALGTTSFIRPTHRGRTITAPTGALAFAAVAMPDFGARAREIWALDRLSAHYAGFVRAFSPLLDAGALSLEAAIITRALLVHEFRRIVLRDPVLPAAYLPGDWLGAAARALFMRLYAALAPQTDGWIAGKFAA